MRDRTGMAKGMADQNAVSWPGVQKVCPSTRAGHLSSRHRQSGQYGGWKDDFLWECQGRKAAPRERRAVAQNAGAHS